MSRRCFVVNEIGRQDLDCRIATLANGVDALDVVIGASIGQIVAGHRCDHNMFQAQTNGGFGQTLWLVAFESCRLAALDGAESAGPSADASEDHERGRFLRIALHAIGALGIVADGLQI